MKRHEMYELAKLGLQTKLKEIQAELQDKYREFPDLFNGPPAFLKADLRHGSSNGSGPVITTLPLQETRSKASQLLPYLVAHGPTRIVDVARALRLRSSGSLSTVIKRHIDAGTIERVSVGTYAATAAGMAAMSGSSRHARKKGGKKSKPPTSTVYQKRAITATMLQAVEEAGSISADDFAQRGFKKGVLGPLVHRGYLKHLRNGEYQRTAKVFIVDTRKSAQP